GIKYFWEYTPTSVNNTLQEVILTASDGIGIAQSSILISKVVRELSGEVTIEGTLEYSQVLTAVVNNTNNTGELQYQWYRDETPISGATLSTYKLGINDNQSKLKVDISSTEEAGIISSAYTETIQYNLIEENVVINNTIFPNQLNECFGATQTITIAENGNEVLFENGSITNLIAGQSIRFLPGTNIQPGAYMHAWITINNSFCDALPEAIVAAPKVAGKSIEDDNLVSDIRPQQASIKVFPNPNNGQFTIVANGFDDNALFIIYNPMGKTILKDILRKENALDLSSYNKGLYFIKTISNNKVLTQKILIR
ncbi:MAG TPA: T9SS type A sorting domain-containing protein, partial [Prolixibacteraceae bacterium]|nr:T9SS type A sorting domain-containing protein [Prolixibacteraceae bacterium]